MRFPVLSPAVLTVFLFFSPPAGAQEAGEEKEGSIPAVAQAQTQQTEGAAAGGDAASDSDGSRSEPLPEGEEILVKGGWIRIEKKGAERKGTYSVVSSSASAYEGEALEERQDARARRVEARPPPERADGGQAYRKKTLRCPKEKEAYLRELFRIAGINTIDVPFPLELLQALEETPGVLNLAPSLPLAWAGVPVAAGGIGVDPIRALGWDEGLRWAAEDLVRCNRNASH